MKALAASVVLICFVAGGTLGLVAFLAYERDAATRQGEAARLEAMVPDRALLAGPTSTPRIVTAPTAPAGAPRFFQSSPTSTPIVSGPVLMAQTPNAAPPTATAVRAPRPGCDPAYPEERTCILPGPPFDQGCAITDQRLFEVLPPDPQGLDHDGDSIGCEPIASSS